MMTYLDLEITVMVEGQEYAAQVIVAVIEEGKDYRDKRFNNIVRTAKPLKFLISHFSVLWIDWHKSYE